MMNLINDDKYNILIVINFMVSRLLAQLAPHKMGRSPCKQTGSLALTKKVPYGQSLYIKLYHNIHLKISHGGLVDITEI